MTFATRFPLRLVCASAVLAATQLTGCASIAPDKMEEIAATDTEYTTGSNIPRKKSTGNVATMSADTAEELRRMNEPRPVRN